jgi:hypothetical protein
MSDPAVLRPWYHPAEPFDPNDPRNVVPPELIPNLDELEIEDGKPMENIFAEKQQRLLTEPIYSSRPLGERPVLVCANVGLFYKMKTPGLAPDIMLSLDVQLGADLERRENRSYYIWEMGKSPEVVIEFVSDRRGDETAYKMTQYEQIGVTYYVVFDPGNRLGEGVLRSFALVDRTYQPMAAPYFPAVGLGVRLWEGSYENQPGRWLRWCDAESGLVATGAERADAAEQRALTERQQREKAEERALASQEEARAARELADQERRRREQLEARLRELGLEP